MIKEKAERILPKIGISMNLKGARYIVYIMELFEESWEWKTVKTMILYEKVAMKYKVSCGAVEKAIRYAFSEALSRGNLEMLSRYLGCAEAQNRKLLESLYMNLSRCESETERLKETRKETMQMLRYVKTEAERLLKNLEKESPYDLGEP